MPKTSIIFHHHHFVRNVSHTFSSESAASHPARHAQRWLGNYFWRTCSVRVVRRRSRVRVSASQFTYHHAPQSVSPQRRRAALTTAPGRSFNIDKDMVHLQQFVWRSRANWLDVSHRELWLWRTVWPPGCRVFSSSAFCFGWWPLMRALLFDTTVIKFGAPRGRVGWGQLEVNGYCATYRNFVTHAFQSLYELGGGARLLRQLLQIVRQFGLWGDWREMGQNWYGEMESIIGMYRYDIRANLLCYRTQCSIILLSNTFW